MNRESVATVVVCVACLLAVSTAASTLDSAVSTDPDEAIALDSESLPVGTEGVTSLKSQVQSEGTRGETAGGSEAGEQSSAAAASQSEPGSAQRSADRAGAAERAESGDGSAQSGGSASGTHQAPGGASESLLDRLLDLLQAVLAALARLLPVLLALGALALAAWYRERLRAAVRDRLEAWGLVDPARDDGGRERRAPAAPTNEVAEAWYEFVEALGLGDVRSCAPRECAARARAAGVDDAVVTDLTEPFEEVRYANRPVTEARSERARSGLERFRAQYDGGQR